MSCVGLHSCTGAAEIAGCRDWLSKECLSPKWGSVKTTLMPLVLCNLPVQKSCCGSNFCRYLSRARGAGCWACSYRIHRGAWTGHGCNADRWHLPKLLQYVFCWWAPASPGEEQKWFGYASFTLGECAKGVLAGSGLPASAVLAYHCQKVDFFFFFPGPLISA